MRLPLLLVALAVPAAAADFPPPDSAGGWPTQRGPAALDRAFDYIQTTTKNGGLLVLHRGRLVYERYFGLAHRDAAPNPGSVGKSFTSIAVGILISEHRDLFPKGLDQKVFAPQYFPAELFPLRDPRMAEIRLGQLLSMTAGIRGNNPGVIHGKEVTLDPPGPDGWQGMYDPIVMGLEDGEARGQRTTTKTLWVEPGGGYSYATASIHLASILLRHVSGMELEDYVREKLAEPMGWGRWGWGYREQIRDHTPGGGGIALRPTDMLRFGYLLLNEGVWDGHQLVPAGYIRHASNPSPYNPHYDYSLQFRVNGRGYWDAVPRDAFWKTGSGGYSLYVIPSLELVVYKMGGRDSQYSEANTGLPPTPGFRYDGSREGWKAVEEPGVDPYRKTLDLVLDALTAPQ